MTAVITDVPGENVATLVNEFVSENATNLQAMDPNAIPDPTLPASQRPSGLYLQSDGSWTVVADVPDEGDQPAPVGGGQQGGQAAVGGGQVGPAGGGQAAVDGGGQDTPVDLQNDPQIPIQSPADFQILTDLKQTISSLTAQNIDDYFRMQPAGHQDLQGIGTPVIAAAQKYGINASYIVSHAILETGWGTSRIFKQKNNLFGWYALDADPNRSTQFDSPAACIDYVMGRVNTKYLTKGGEWFVKAPCVGNKQIGMNVNYAAESDWGANIASIAQRMGKKLGLQTPAPAQQGGGAQPVAAVQQAAGPASKVRGTRGEFVVDHKIPGSSLAIPHGVFSIIADDGSVLGRMEANTGGFVSTYTKHNGPIPPGTYLISNYQSPRNDEGEAMRYFGISFSFSLTPTNGTNVYDRDGLDIHPDGPPPGTHGCIGLVAQTKQDLAAFRDLLRAHTSGGSHLTVTVTYTPTAGVS